MSSVISVIVPVYNADKYLSKCIESLLGQTFSDIEIILINDGSSDHSTEICQSYAFKDSRIIFIEQDNKGVCEARNAGLNVAQGHFIVFVDADDWMDADGLTTLLDEHKQNGADLVVADMSFIEGNYTRRIKVFDKAFTTDDPKWIMNYQRACIGYGYNPNPGTKYNITGLGSMGNKLYVRSIIEDNCLRFDPYTLGSYEDNLFVLHYLECCNRVSYVPQSIYYYRKVGDSNSRGYKEDMLEISDRIFEKLIEFIRTYKLSCADDFYKAFHMFVIRRLDASLNSFFFAKQNVNSFTFRLKQLNELIRSEPYKTSIEHVEYKLLNPKNHRITRAAARTKSALIIWCSFRLRLFTRKLITFCRIL
jgi:glycosyltransferase involved in cell wall biosynthesis